jgi:predicted transposase YbfD/YdcC
MDLSTFEKAEQIGQENLVIYEASLYREFEKVNDGRAKKGQRYPLAFVLTLLMLGKMAGETTISGVREWVQEREKDLRKKLNWPKDFPVNNTYTDVLAKTDPNEINMAIARVIEEAREITNYVRESIVSEVENGGKKKLIHTAMDGKTLRGTRGHAKEHQPSVHLLALYDVESGIVIRQEAVKKKNNEITASAALLRPHLVKGRIISTDAMHTQWKFCMFVHYNDGYYLLVAKKNQKAIWKYLHSYFENKDVNIGKMSYHKEEQKGHGRLEVREIWTSTEIDERFQKKWPGIAQIYKIRRYVKEGDKEREEIVYGFTNLPTKIAKAEHILNLNQEHWYIENRLHYRRDVTMGEDASQVRIEHAPQALAAINGGVLALMDFLGVKNVASQMRHFCAHPEEAIYLLFGNISTVLRVN